MKRLAIITGEYPDVPSGIGDYAYNLVKTLNSDDIYVITSIHKDILDDENVFKVDWTFFSLYKIFKFLKFKSIGNVNIQFPPTLLGKYSFKLQVLCIVIRICGVKVITTLHEFDNLHFLRKLSVVPFLVFSNKIIVVLDDQKRNILKKFPFIKDSKIRSISIGSNISKVNNKINFDSKIITFFGVFYPSKNSEKAVDYMAKIEELFPSRYVFRFVGATHPYYKEYMSDFQRYANSKLKNTEWKLNSPLNEVGQHLKDSFVSILYYNDGLSLRRGSFLAMAVNGIPVVSNKKKETIGVDDIELNGLYWFDETLDISDDVKKLFEDADEYSKCSRNIGLFGEQFTFSSVAKQYIDFMEL